MALLWSRDLGDAPVPSPFSSAVAVWRSWLACYLTQNTLRPTFQFPWQQCQGLSGMHCCDIIGFSANIEVLNACRNWTSALVPNEFGTDPAALGTELLRVVLCPFSPGWSRGFVVVEINGHRVWGRHVLCLQDFLNWNVGSRTGADQIDRTSWKRKTNYFQIETRHSLLPSHCIIRPVIKLGNSCTLFPCSIYNSLILEKKMNCFKLDHKRIHRTEHCNSDTAFKRVLLILQFPSTFDPFIH